MSQASIPRYASRHVALSRFYTPDLQPNATEIALSSEESHHLMRVLRLAVGADVVVFDGRGRAFHSRVARIAAKIVTVSIGAPIPPLPSSSIPIVLVQAVVKGNSMDDVVRDATMVGAAAIAPVVTERSLVSLAALARARAVERWQRIAVASAKQCGQAALPIIEAPRPLEAWLKTPFVGRRVIFVEPHADGADDRSVRSLHDVLAGPKPPAITCIVGPEGGRTVKERDMAVEAGCDAATLGSMTLRADAAGLVAVSLVTFALEAR